jgi:hypothetical protein
VVLWILLLKGDPSEAEVEAMERSASIQDVITKKETRGLA